MRIPMRRTSFNVFFGSLANEIERPHLAGSYPITCQPLSTYFSGMLGLISLLRAN